MKIIFLDIDGVLNCEAAYTRRLSHGFCQYKEFEIKSGEKDHYQTFYPPCKKLINELIDKTSAKIVISSSWRGSGLEWLRRVWAEEGMLGEIIDVTPSFRNKDYSVPRGCEIDYWLQSKGFRKINWSKAEQQKYIDESGIENYIIIDDDSDMLYNQRDNFVHVLPSPRNKNGFNRFYLKEAIQKLNYSLIDRIIE